MIVLFFCSANTQIVNFLINSNIEKLAYIQYSFSNRSFHHNLLSLLSGTHLPNVRSFAMNTYLIINDAMFNIFPNLEKIIIVVSHKRNTVLKNLVALKLKRYLKYVTIIKSRFVNHDKEVFKSSLNFFNGNIKLVRIDSAKN